MGSVHKQQQKNLTEEVDKLGNLPSCIIGHILSFLPTKYAVRTSILSTTWKNNWKSITNLDFDASINYSYRPSGYMQASFVNFVYRVLLHLESSRLNKVRLPFFRDLKDSDAIHINSWVSAALSRNVQEIRIFRIGLEEACFLPSELFKCQTLVVLELSEGFLKVPNSVCLPNLKLLRLDQIKFYDGESCGRLISNSPVLEEFLLEYSTFTNISVLKISSPGLKKLVLNGDPDLPNYRFQLDAPQLESLYFQFYFPEQGTFKNLHSLLVAHIDFSSENYVTKEVFDDLKTKSPVFLKLKTLYYWVRDVDGFFLMKDMVECSPHLESLSLEFDSPMPLEKITHNICKPLNQVELWFEGNVDDTEFVKHILKNANALKKFVIHWESFSDEIREEVLAFPRASTSCEVVFNY